MSLCIVISHPIFVALIFIFLNLIEWRKDGWAVPVDYHLVDAPLKVSDYMAQIGPLLPARYSPLKADGKGNQAYLFPVPEAMAAKLLELLEVDFDDVGD